MGIFFFFPLGRNRTNRHLTRAPIIEACEPPSNVWSLAVVVVVALERYRKASRSYYNVALSIYSADGAKRNLRAASRQSPAARVDVLADERLKNILEGDFFFS